MPAYEPDADGWIVNDWPENLCFGCSPRNERGFQLRFRQPGEFTIEAPFHTDEHWCGAPGVVHGGLQAALLDEVMAMAAKTGFPDEDAQLVTASFELKYREPVETGQQVTLRGTWQRSEGRNSFVTGEIVAADGRVLTSAEARWVRIG